MHAKCLCSDSDCACIESRQRGPCGTYSPSCGLAEMQHGHQQQPLCGNKRNSAGLSLRSQGLNACLPLEQRDCWMFGCHTRIIRIPGGSQEGPRGSWDPRGTPVGPPCDPPGTPMGPVAVAVVIVVVVVAVVLVLLRPRPRLRPTTKAPAAYRRPALHARHPSRRPSSSSTSGSSSTSSGSSNGGSGSSSSSSICSSSSSSAVVVVVARHL